MVTRPAWEGWKEEGRTEKQQDGRTKQAREKKKVSFRILEDERRR
jgi:hypothetical protein